MQLIQRRAILAILSMIESAVREIRSVIADDSDPGAHTAVAVPRASYVPDGALSDQEDRTLEEMMEAHRQALLKGAGSLAERFYTDSEEPS